MAKKILAICIFICFCFSMYGCSKEVEDCDISINYGGEKIQGKYSGTINNNKPLGKGSFIGNASYGRITLAGQWDDTGFHSVGKLESDKYSIMFENKKYIGIYDGDIVDGVPCGSGMFSYQDGNNYLRYSGNWKDGKFSDKGQLEASTYTVTFSDTKRTGEYIGDVLNGVASGNGKFSAENSDGISYEYNGEWKDGLFNGQGCVTWGNNESYIEDGTFKNGKFTPSVYEFFKAFGTYKDQKYILNDNASKILQKYPDVFTKNKTKDLSFDNKFSYKSYAKNTEKYGDKFINLTNLTVIQLFEDSYWDIDNTFCIAQDNEGNVYSIRLYGYVGDIYQGDIINSIVLPMDYFTYKNVLGNSIWAIACAGVSIKLA